MTKLERLQALEREEAKRPLGRYYADYRDALFAAALDLIRVALAAQNTIYPSGDGWKALEAALELEAALAPLLESEAGDA